MSAKMITTEYANELSLRIEQGERPRKTGEDAIAPKDFVQRMLPHIKAFLIQGYTHKEIAKFLGHVSGEDLKKAVEKDAATLKKVLKKDAATLRKEEKSSKSGNADEQNEATKPASTPAPCKRRKSSRVGA